MAYDPLDELRKKKTLVRPEGTVSATPQALVPQWKVGDPLTEQPFTTQAPAKESFDEYAQQLDIQKEQGAEGARQRSITNAEQAVAQATSAADVPLNRLTPEYYESLVQTARDTTAGIKEERQQVATKEAETTAYHTAEAEVAKVEATRKAAKEAIFREEAVAEARIKVYGAKPKAFTTEALLASLKQKRQFAEALATKNRMTHPSGTNAVWKLGRTGLPSGVIYEKPKEPTEEEKAQPAQAPPYVAQLGMFEGKPAPDALLASDRENAPIVYKNAVDKFTRNLPETMVGKKIDTKEELQKVIESVPGYGLGIQGSAANIAEEYLLKADPNKYAEIVGRSTLDKADASIIASVMQEEFPSRYEDMSNAEIKKAVFSSPESIKEYSRLSGQRAMRTVGSDGKLTLATRQMMSLNGASATDTTGLTPTTKEEVRAIDIEIATAVYKKDTAKVAELEANKRQVLTKAIYTRNYLKDVEENGSFDERSDVLKNQMDEGSEDQEDTGLGINESIVKTQWHLTNRGELDLTKISTKSKILKTGDGEVGFVKYEEGMSSEVLGKELLTAMNTAFNVGKGLSLEEAATQVLLKNKDNVSAYNEEAAKTIIKGMIDSAASMNNENVDSARDASDKEQAKQTASMMNTIVADVPTAETVKDAYTKIRTQAEEDINFALEYQLDDEAPMSDKELALAYFGNRYGPEVIPFLRSVVDGKVGYRESPLLRKVAAAFGEITEAMGIQQSNYADKKAIEAEQPQKNFERISLFEREKYEKTFTSGAGFTSAPERNIRDAITATQLQLSGLGKIQIARGEGIILEEKIKSLEKEMVYERGRYIPTKNIEAMSSFERLDTYYGMEAVIESDPRLTDDDKTELLNDLTPKIKAEEDKVSAEKKALPGPEPSLWQRIWGVDTEEVSALVPEPTVGPLTNAPVTEATARTPMPTAEWIVTSARPAAAITPVKPTAIEVPTEKPKAPTASQEKVATTKPTGQKPIEVAKVAVKQAATEYGKYSPEIRAQVESETPPKFSDKELVSFATKEARKLASQAGEKIDVAVETLGNMAITAGKITNVAVAALGDVTIKASTWPIELGQWYAKKTEEQKIKFLLGMEDRMVEAWKLEKAKELSKTQ